MKLESLIGHHLNSQVAKPADWLGYWPGVNGRGIIKVIYEGDQIPDDATLVDWSNNKPRGGHPVITNAEHGFEAVLIESDWGGARRGSGRKRLAKPLQTISVTLYASQVKRLNATGNASKALREILK